MSMVTDMPLVAVITGVLLIRQFKKAEWGSSNTKSQKLGGTAEVLSLSVGNNHSSRVTSPRLDGVCLLSLRG